MAIFRKSNQSIFAMFLLFIAIWIFIFILFSAIMHCELNDISERSLMKHVISKESLTNLRLEDYSDHSSNPFPDLVFQAEHHGEQIFVHTLLAVNVSFNKHDVSWVTQMTTDRIDIFSKMMQRWHGPGSVTVYCRNLTHDLDAIAPYRDRFDFHLVLADFHPGRLYPVNTLRNVAINKCRTHWMFLVDADFVPNNGLYEDLLPQLPAWERGDNAVYVVAAFQLQGKETRIPTDQTDLLAMGDRVSPVHPEPGRDIAHKHTDYPRWRTSTEVYEVRYRMPYEPYFVASKRVPRYATSFVGYGNDKAAQSLELHYAGVRFRVLPKAFVFHHPHPRGDWQRSDTDWSVRAPAALARFMVDVRQRYGLPDPAVRPVGGEAGENCTAVCARAGLGCREDGVTRVNRCEALLEAFGDRCGGSCRDHHYGTDLPAFNQALGQCLVNRDPDNFGTTCRAHNPQSARVCPCGAALAQWLTPEYLAKKLGREGNWSLPSSLRG